MQILTRITGFSAEPGLPYIKTEAEKEEFRHRRHIRALERASGTIFDPIKIEDDLESRAVPAEPKATPRKAARPNKKTLKRERLKQIRANYLAKIK